MSALKVVYVPVILVLSTVFTASQYYESEQYYTYDGYSNSEEPIDVSRFAVAGDPEPREYVPSLRDAQKNRSSGIGYRRGPTDDDDDYADDVETRIAVGRAVIAGEAPYHLQIRYRGEYQCGAALVWGPFGHQVAITTAKCVTESGKTKILPIRRLSVVGARVRRNGYHQAEQTLGVSKIDVHPDFRYANKIIYHDIAVIQFKGSFTVNRLVQMIELPKKEKVAMKEKTAVTLTGWGYYDVNEKEYAVILQKDIVEVGNLRKCSGYYSWKLEGKQTYNGKETWNEKFLLFSTFCLPNPGGNRFQGGCKGDEGSPAVAIEKEQLYLAGVYSWSLPKCGNRFQPSLYVGVSWYLNWFRKIRYITVKADA